MLYGYSDCRWMNRLTKKFTKKTGVLSSLLVKTAMNGLKKLKFFFYHIFSVKLNQMTR